MGISIRQPGETTDTARAGAIIDKGQRAQEERARAEREAVRKAEEKARMKAQETAMAWELQKMQMESQRAYMRETRQEDYRLAAADRAAEGAIDRIEFSKNLDHQYKEKQRLEKISRAQAKYDRVKKHIAEGLVDPPEKSWQTKTMLWDLSREIDELSPRAMPKQDQMAEYLQSLMPGVADSPEIQPANPMPTMYQEAVNDKTGEKIVSRDGGKTWEPVAPERTIPPANFEAFSRNPSTLIRKSPFFNR